MLLRYTVSREHVYIVNLASFEIWRNSCIRRGCYDHVFPPRTKNSTDLVEIVCHSNPYQVHFYVRIMCKNVWAYKRPLRTLLLMVLMPIEKYGTDRYVILSNMDSNSSYLSALNSYPKMGLYR